VVCLERLRASKEKLMFDNVVRLIGFVGSDAELKTTKAQREYAVLSLATTASWKDKNGDGYIRRTEWHRLVAWGNLSTFAATLKKGSHVSVEGELRYREFVPKRQKKSKNGDQKIRVAEIHLSKIAKIDRPNPAHMTATIIEGGGTEFLCSECAPPLQIRAMSALGFFMGR
jgi:single-strand DNA-binding protein